jgi:ketosteroid isomerase-like protein
MPLQKPIYTTPQDAEQAFYDAIRRADLEAFMNVWAEDEEVICILPNGPRLSGYINVREAWRRIFDSGRRFNMDITQPVVLPGMLVTIHNVHEHIALLGDEEGHTAVILATNIYIRSAAGWRILVHHASLTLSGEDASEITKTLH